MAVLENIPGEESGIGGNTSLAREQCMRYFPASLIGRQESPRRRIALSSTSLFHGGFVLIFCTRKERFDCYYSVVRGVLTQACQAVGFRDRTPHIETDRIIFISRTIAASTGVAVKPLSWPS